ncbi:MAG: guanylate kinase [Firmicutes bacterium]|nr:guanylate kinase [Bacillota bacterium]
MSAKPLLIIISGPSGSGKGTLCNRLRQALPDLMYSVSVTTRPSRPGEIHGVDYFFITEADFLKQLQAGEFLEWAEVYGNYYGTPRRPVETWLREGKDVLLELDIQGAQQVRKIFPQALLIFITPPSLEELGVRITKRGTDTEETIRKRLKFAPAEIQAAKDYNYVVVNDREERALAELLSIIEKEKERLNAERGDRHGTAEP